MRTLLAIALIAVCLAGPTAAKIVDDPPPMAPGDCAPSQEVFQRLAQRVMMLVFWGKGLDGGKARLWKSPTSGFWILTSSREGRTCIVADGEYGNVVIGLDAKTFLERWSPASD